MLPSESNIFFPQTERLGDGKSLLSVSRSHSECEQNDGDFPIKILGDLNDPFGRLALHASRGVRPEILSFLSDGTRR